MSIIYGLLFVVASAISADVEVSKDKILLILKNTKEYENIKSIVSMKTSVADTEDFTDGWTVTRAELQLEKDTGEILDKSFKVVTYTASAENQEKVNKTGFFINDLMMYRHVIPEMESLLLEVNDESARPWTIAYGVEESAIHLLEDLEREGYVKLAKGDGLDLKHSTSAMKLLAKFHALSAALNEKGTIPVDKFYLSYLEKNGAALGNYYDQLMSDFAKSIDLLWGEEWAGTSDKIMAKQTDVIGQIVKMQQRNNDNFNVINHGSYITEDLRFKYGSPNPPITIKMRGFWTAYWNSPAFDVVNYLYTSTKSEVLLASGEELINTYHDSLIDYLKTYGFKGPLPTKEFIDKEISRIEYYGLVTAVSERINESLTPEEMEKLAEENMNYEEGEVREFNNNRMLTKVYIESMKQVLDYAIKRNAI